MSKTKIEWVQNPDGTQGKTWNPITGCTKVSAGCTNCYAERMARRLAGRYGYPEAPNHFDVTLHPDRLNEPLRRKKPTIYFVASMGDLFHEDVEWADIAAVWEIMDLAEQHVFQVLTKRPMRVIQFLLDYWIPLRPCAPAVLPNVWLGVSAENQAAANKRIPLLLQTPAAVRFVSCEPLLEAIDLSPWLYEKGGGSFPIGLPRQQPRLPPSWHQPRLSWVIVGGESGPGARPMHPQWARDIRDQCQAARAPFFFKQWGAWFPRSQWEDNPELILPNDGLCFEGRDLHFFGHVGFEEEIMHRVGKKRAGHLLDGRESKEFPHHESPQG